MSSWTNDSQLHILMRAYLAAASRLEQGVTSGLDDDELDELRADKREAAKAYEDALVARGWQVPGLVVGARARVARW